jgi:heme/copper-type cytochrome/quinol oxidase subunit 3
MRIGELIRLRWLVGTLLIAAATLFAVGVATEGDVHHETGTATHEETGEAGEGAAHHEAGEVAETGERVLGVNLESTPLVVTAVAISIVLAAATWRRDRRLVLLVTALFAAGFAVLDVAEFSHQIRRSAVTIAVIAAVIAILHAAAALLAEQRRTAGA